MVSLEEICDFKGGGTPSKKKKSYWNGDIPWASIKDMKGAELTSTIDKITDLGVQESSTSIAEPGEIILATRIAPGRPIISKIRTAINQDLKIVRPKININTTYLYYAFKSIEKDVLKISSGTTVLGVRLNNLRELKIPLPPLPEQQAIVAKLDELLGALDRGVGELERGLGRLVGYRASVLREGFAGRLTGSDTDYQVVRLEGHIDKPKYGTSQKCIQKPVGTPVLRIPNIKLGFVDHTDLKYAEFNEDEKSKYDLQPGDLLIIRSNGSVDLVGTGAIVRAVDTKFLFAGYLIRLRPKATLDSKYLHYCLQSVDLRRQIEDKAKSTSGVNNINSKELQALQIPLPPLPEQHRIVAEIESRLSVAEAMEREIVGALSRVKGLRMGVLGRAFGGGLVDMDTIKDAN